jgi:hypothetical protein
MKKEGFVRLIFSWVLLFGMLLPPVVAGQTAPVAERQKIESLIKQVGDLKDAKFVRKDRPTNPQPQSVFFAVSGKPATPK